MQWMTMTSVMPCHALHVPQHAAASPFEPLNHSNDFLRPSCRSRIYITGTGKSSYAGFCLELPSPRLNLASIQLQEIICIYTRLILIFVLFLVT